MISVIHITLTSQAEADHTLTVSINNAQLKHITMPADESQTHVIEYGIQYHQAQYKSLLFDWQGIECAKKFLHIRSIKLDDKPINMDKFMCVPNKTDYINSMDVKELQHKQLNAGNNFGWYGQYKLNVLFGDRKEYKLKQHDPRVLLGMLHL